MGLPRPLTPAETMTLRDTTSPLILAIEPAGNDDIAEELVAILRAHGTYSEVGFASQLGSRADLVGRIEYEHEPLGAAIPLLSIVTLGVVPSFYHEPQTVSLQFDSLPQRIRVETRADAPLVMGWVGLLLRASPSWALVKEPRRLPGNSRRLAEHLASALAARSEEIRFLASRMPRR